MDQHENKNSKMWPEFEFSSAVEAPTERKIIRATMFIICAAVFIMLIWSMFTNVNEIAKTHGQVVPLGHKQVIQNKRGGTIQSVLVAEGDMVTKGQPLVRFISVDSQSQKDELEAKRANFILKMERYNAFLMKRKPDFSAFTEDFPDLVKTHQQAYQDMLEKLQTLISVSKTEITQTKEEIHSINNELPALRSQLALANHMLNLMKSGTASKVISELEWNNQKQKRESYARELSSLTGKKAVLEKSLLHLDEELKEKKADYESEVSELRTEAQTELITTEARLRSSNSELEDNTVRSPVDGIVQSIPTTNEGSVIQPGGMVAIIVPITKTAIMETKLSPRDIGFIKLGQVARIKVDAFDYSRYGSLEGIVEKISPTTDADERGGVYYKVRISIARPYYFDNPDQFKLMPGMTGEADVVTGKKTVFEYLWKPVYTNITTAFGER
ncbi:HlyD family type I secretion periplasmic adaptor subunit [Psychromonas sp. RZ22]|uniref:HlyD family type I secretion periplasmic adaptor subunit n=1 Tax=Psychromonas algarum TaxID=2555643 RepID=UPI00106830D0|nr:HlyD family type I secretion periplasmic adaptor subunit [Psychromonas sp. RZ22]TEW53207.1 HlyD family type I secretion periplasmic adaptor subunit [Psychromonas sp. RZ22]